MTAALVPQFAAPLRFGSGLVPVFMRSVPSCGSTKLELDLSTARPVEISAMLAPARGITTVPNLLITRRARMSDAPVMTAPFMKRASHSSIDCTSDEASLMPPLDPSHGGGVSSTMPLQSSSCMLPGTSTAPGFTVGLQSSQSPWAPV